MQSDGKDSDRSRHAGIFLSMKAGEDLASLDLVGLPAHNSPLYYP